MLLVPREELDKEMNVDVNFYDVALVSENKVRTIYMTRSNNAFEDEFNKYED